MSDQRGVRPDYMVGTVTLTSGSRNFTTSGASLQSANVQAGDAILTAGGLMLIIDTITGQNAGTLRHNSPIAANNVQLVVRFQSDGSRYPGAVRDFIGRWGQTGNLDAIAGLATAKDMLAYFTGAGTVDTTALTAWARTLLAAANGDAAYGALGMVPDGSFPNRLKSVKPSVTDFNTVSENGWYWGSMATANTPDASASWYMEHINYGTSAYCVQYATIVGTTSPRTFTRKKSNNVWGSWETTMLPILGTVSQSGGVPTGAIIQSANNASGSFVRLADGTQICWGKAEVIHSNSNSNTGRLGGEWAYPAAFSASDNEVFMNTPIQQAANWTGITGAQSGRGSARAGGAASSATGATLSIFFDSGTVSTTEGRVQNISLMVIGRWY